MTRDGGLIDGERRVAGVKRRAFFGYAVVACALAACDPVRSAPPLFPGAERTDAVLALEKEMFERVNRDRGERGLPPLTYDPALADVARNHAADMRQHKFFAHESPNTGKLDERLIRWDYAAKVARENLAEAPTVSVAEDGLLKSPHHFENLMARDITHVGIGIVKGGVGDPRNLLAVQVFARPIVPVSSDALVDRVLAKITAARRGAPLRRDATLDDLAADYAEAIPVTMNEADLARETKRALAALPSGTKYRGLIGFASLVYDAEDIGPPEAALGRNVTALGMAAVDAKDERGQACHKLVALFAY